jgi:hypothetical protein
MKPARQRMNEAMAEEDKAYQRLRQKAGITPGMGPLEEMQQLRDYGAGLVKSPKPPIRARKRR